MILYWLLYLTETGPKYFKRHLRTGNLVFNTHNNKWHISNENNRNRATLSYIPHQIDLFRYDVLSQKFVTKAYKSMKFCLLCMYINSDTYHRNRSTIFFLQPMLQICELNFNSKMKFHKKSRRQQFFLVVFVFVSEIYLAILKEEIFEVLSIFFEFPLI